MVDCEFATFQQFKMRLLSSALLYMFALILHELLITALDLKACHARATIIPFIQAQINYSFESIIKEKRKQQELFIEKVVDR